MGFWELVVIAVIGLVVLGPERLPVAIRTISRWVTTVRQFSNVVKAEINNELRIQELHKNLKEAEQKGMKDLSPELQASVDELKSAAEDLQQPYAKKPSGTVPDASQKAKHDAND
ncbi:Sec-independent protein translocase protein TatB [Algicola sagamiensis]|uniref:Sec-independent protein translocase protein TatB n=1 Tax=Algicola sagamiensis TaxID=163869 RepID=UPI000373F5BF|nr:Sec-independent protein translocase protein TatB [Algicola sagamiensis]